jgi:hypothetical protein
MSTVLLDTPQLRVVQYCGPARADGGDRRRYEFHPAGAPSFTMSYEDFMASLALVQPGAAS